MTGASFKGNLEVLNLSDIFQSLAMNRHSGTLIISDKKREKKIYFSEGEIQLLSSSRRMRLGELLISTGKITEEDLDLALKLQKQNRKKLGEILVEEGFCDEDEIARIVKYQIEEEIYDLFLWRKAEFEFIADHIPDDMKRGPSNLMRLQLNTNSLIMEALRRLDEWELVKQAVPSTKEIFVVADESKLEGVELPERLRTEIRLIDGKTNVEGLAEKTLISEFELCKLLADLVHHGAIKALPMEELVQRAEEAYAVNDFTAASALYGRLAELAPGEPKVLIPLADSLRRSGDDRQALGIFEEIARKLDPVRDLERLRRCWESIIALDPERTDLAKKLQDMDARATAKRRTLGTVPIVVTLLGGVVVLLLVFKPQIQAWLVHVHEDPNKLKKQEEERLANALLTDMTYAQNMAMDYKKWHAIGVKILKDYPRTKARDKVVLPVLVRTDPPGYAITVNGLPQGVTTAEKPVVVGKYATITERLVIQVRKLSKDSNVNLSTSEVLKEKVLEHPDEWPEGGEVKFSLDDSPIQQIVSEAPVDTDFAWHPGAKAWIAIGRDGHACVLDETLKPLAGWQGVAVGSRVEAYQNEFCGDRYSAATIVGDRAYVGLTVGGVAVLDLNDKKVSAGSFPVDQGAVLGRPLVLSRQSRVVFASSWGVVYGYAIEGGKSPKWRYDCEGVIQFAGVLADDEGGSVAFASTDERLRALDSVTGKPLWAKPPVVGSPVAPIVRVKKDILVANADGELLAVNARDGTVREQRYQDPFKKTFTFCVDDAGDRIFLATEDGRIRALSFATLAPVWEKDYTQPTTRRPQIAYLAAGGVSPARLLVAFDEPRLLGLDPANGTLTWRGILENAGQVVAPPSVAGDKFLVATSNSFLLEFKRP